MSEKENRKRLLCRFFSCIGYLQQEINLKFRLVLSIEWQVSLKIYSPKIDSTDFLGAELDNI